MSIRIALVAMGIAAVLLGGGTVLLRSTDDGPRAPLTGPTAATQAAQAAGARMISASYDYGTGVHVTERVAYATNPPTNGPHHPEWAVDGNYVGTEPPDTERIVHALEHGRIVIWYRPDLPAAEIRRLERLFDEDPYHVLLVPRAGLPCPVAATAWSRGVLCPAVDERSLDALRAFRDAYRDQGPERVP